MLTFAEKSKIMANKTFRAAIWSMTTSRICCLVTSAVPIHK